MLLKFGDDFCPPGESIAWIWHEGDSDPIRCRPISIIAVVDVDLPRLSVWFTGAFIR